MAKDADQTTFRDYYETLQLSPNADIDTINRVYRILVRRYHPDNSETGNQDKFAEILEAHRVLADAEKRAAYDVTYEDSRAAELQIFSEASNGNGFDADRRIFDGILSLLYIARRREPGRGGMGVVQLERMLGCPAQHLEFHLWYLMGRSWVERQPNGQFAITVAGVDQMIERDSTIVRRDRLIVEKPPQEPASGTAED